MRQRPLVFVSLLFLVVVVNRDAAAEDSGPPWTDDGDVPIPSWTRSVAPNKSDAAFYSEPGLIESRRGSAQLGARLPFYATKRARGCQGRWLEVGPMAWICSDVADYSQDDPSFLPIATHGWMQADGKDAFVTPRSPTHPMPPIAPAVSTDDGLPFPLLLRGARRRERFPKSRERAGRRAGSGARAGLRDRRARRTQRPR